MKSSIITILSMIVTLSPCSGQESSVADLYSMSAEQLENISDSVISKEIQKLENRNQSEIQELQTLKSANTMMCQKLAQFEAVCPSFRFLIPEQGEKLSCSKTAPVVQNVRVEIQNSEGKSFRLIANHSYASSVFNSSKLDQIRFERLDTKYVPSLRFRDLSSLSIVAVRSNSQIINRVVTERVDKPSNLQVKIFVGNTPLLEDFTLFPTDDETNASEFRINPKEIVMVNKAQGCSMNLQEINQFQTQRN